MKKTLLAFCLLTVLVAFAQTNNNAVALIPQPVSLVTKTGQFVLPSKVIIVADNNAAVKRLSDRLANVITTATGKTAVVQTTKSTTPNTIRLSLSYGKLIPAEGYKLNVSSTGVLLEASTPAGLFYGTQTLLQLLPPEINNKTTVSRKTWTIPAVTIVDSPRFGWRGWM